MYLCVWIHLEIDLNMNLDLSKTIKVATRSARLSRHVTQECTAYFQWRRKSFQNVNIHYNQSTNCTSCRKYTVMIRDYITVDVQRWNKVFCTTNNFTGSKYFLEYVRTCTFFLFWKSKRDIFSLFWAVYFRNTLFSSSHIFFNL